MKIYTKTGDQGETSLFGGKRVSKADIRLEAYGSADELNAYIGWLCDMEVNHVHEPVLRSIQDRIFTIGAELAADPSKKSLKKPPLQEVDVEILEKEIDSLQIQLPPLTKFILPGGHRDVSIAHVARTVCRRCERHVVHLLGEEKDLHPLIITYLNRLSDYLFVLSRWMAKEMGVREIFWNPKY
ncbi:MAG: cob(I)yrinic acid a,c-diamide adenosyltransferase [Cytophagaceae bacterium]|nr:cob(I)yrinic acid a,c-diamide adenosyltransferase [Cytophagaceae bacterium]